ncbi:MAG: hypothetical protein ACLUKN_05495 [Bacilli bacterium]
MAFKSFVFAAAIWGRSFVLVEEIADMRTFIDGETCRWQKKLSFPRGGIIRHPKTELICSLKILKTSLSRRTELNLYARRQLQQSALKTANLKIEGLVIDYDPLPYTQGKIVSMSDDKMSFEVEIFEGYGDVKMSNGETGLRYSTKIPAV